MPGGESRTLKLELKDGASVDLPHLPVPGASCAGEVRLYIEKPVDRWRVTVGWATPVA